MSTFDSMTAAERDMVVAHLREACRTSANMPAAEAIMVAVEELESGRGLWANVMIGILFSAVLIGWSTIVCATETSRYDNNPAGPLLSVSSVRADEVTVEFTLGEFQAVGGGHLVIGRGDMQGFFNRGERLQGEGVIIGEATVCNAGAGVISAVMETWPDGVLYPESCVNGLSPGVRYSVTLRAGAYRFTNGLAGRVGYPKTVRPPRGYFVFGVSSPTPYILHSVRVRSDLDILK